MYKMDKDLKEDLANCDYYSMFIKKSIKELKTNGLCYVFSKEQVDEISKYIKINLIVEKNECGFTLKINRNKRKYARRKSLYE